MLGKNLHLCFTKLKRTTSSFESSPIPLTEKHHNRSSSTTTTTISSSSSSSILMIKNFNSLYDLTPDSTSKSISRSSDYFSSSDSDTEETTPPDFATVFASQRFFFSSPGRTNSIVESPEKSPPQSDTLIGGGVAIPTYSPDPFMDFRRSMQEMVEARDNICDVSTDWDYLHELLSCYLTLNPKNTHKFIIGAFADLLVSLMTTTTSTSKSDGVQRPDSDISGLCNVSRRLV
ncbi:Ovate protein family [Macleaya cordata]|uniref:Transcription repressor n=1 Tax=Macleaya cordata TaxID=56857 RepID=A0A200QYD4_MACCD|nr:Ovate protein family [Macleaya cordata]